MTTTLIPPTPGPVPDPQSPPPAASGSSRVVAIIVIVFGTLVILGTLASAIFTTVAAASVHSTTRTVAVAGVSSLDVDVDAGSLRVEFADVSEAELDVTSSWGADRWTLEHDGDRLVVATPERFGPWFVGDWFPGRIGEAVLRLPSSLAGADADFALAAGDLTVDGEFGDLRVEVGAGGADGSGTAHTLGGALSAGRAELELANV
jgi:hypothetical protein